MINNKIINTLEAAVPSDKQPMKELQKPDRPCKKNLESSS